MKRVILLAVALLMLCTASAEVYIVHSDTDMESGCALLIDDQGNLITPMYTYDSIYRLDESLPGIYGASPYDYSAYMTRDMINRALRGELEFYEYYRECLLDENGGMLTGFDYYQLYYDRTGGVIIGSRPDGGCDILDTQGGLLSSTDYCWISMNGQGGFVALRAEEKSLFSGEPCAMVYVDAQGCEHELGISLPRWSLQRFSEGFSFVDVDGVNGFYINEQGEQAFGMTFAYGGSFDHGRAIVHEADGYYGMIDRNGRFVLPMVYTDVSQSAEYPEGPVMAVTQDGTLEIYDRESMREITRFKPDGGVSYAFQINAGMIQVYDDDGSTMLLTDGTPLYRQVTSDTEDSTVVWYNLEDDTCPQRIVMETGTWPDRRCSLVDLQGRPVSGEWKLIEGAAWLDGQGRFSVAEYDIVEDEYGRGIDWESYRYGLIDENGNVIHAPVLDSITVLSLDLCWVRSGDVWGLVNNDGVWLATVSDYDYLMD